MILVTGATGHIGNVLVRQLLERGERIRALVRPGRPSLALTNLEVEIAAGDILDPGSLRRAMQGVEVVYHLAAKISLESGANPETERVNLEGTRNVIAAARAAHVRRLVYASSIYAMRIPDQGVVDESCPFDPGQARGTYDRSKAAASLEVQRAAAGGLDAIIVCPTAVAGPYDFHNSEAGRGIRYNMSPGIKFYVEGAYDFVDVRDAAHGFILAAERGRSGETYILGGGRLTVLQVAETIWEAADCRCFNVKIPLWLAYLVADLVPIYSELTGARPFFTRYSLEAVNSNSHISCEKARHELGFHPRPPRAAIADAVRWFQAEGMAVAERGKTAAEAAA